MEQNRLTKVIQFVDEGTKRRIEKGYYGANKDWNPQNEISLYTPSEVEKLKQLGANFEQTPMLEDGVVTFIEVDEQSHKYSNIEKYPPSFMNNKHAVLAMVLKKLGVHEYFIKSDFVLEGNVGHNNNTESGVQVEVAECGSGSAESSSEQNSGLDFKAYNVVAQYKQLECWSPTQKDWDEAKKLAIEANLYSDIADIIELRKPGSGKILCNVEYKKLGGQIDVNISLAKSLTTLACFKDVGSLSGSLKKSLSLNASIKGYYKTMIFFNFKPDDDVQYKKLVDKELESNL